jgi:hypothetical protein
MNYNSQSGQDFFVLKCLNFKRDGTFVEIGSNHPINGNNTYILEKEHNWKGIMVEYTNDFTELYKEHRPNSSHLIQDATLINFYDEFKKINMPTYIDYLQIDLEVDNKSTILTLENLDKHVMDNYKFAVVTFEHDIYRGDFFSTREKSRSIFDRRGYIRVFSDVMHDGNPYEDWYVHTDLVDMDYINKIKIVDSIEYKEIIKILEDIS